MGLFKRIANKGQSKETRAASDTVRPLVARHIYCRICDADQTFTRCWRRMEWMRHCDACGLVFEEPAKLYAHHQPACPRCEEPLEQKGFDYGLCDQCGSKYEIVEGTKPGLLPNKEQRDAMARNGRARRIDE